MHIFMHWTDELHASLIAIADQVNRLDSDRKLLSAAGVSMDRALFPLLSRIAMRPNISVAELANIVARDHSTVSRQIIKLEELGFIHRRPDPLDRRVRKLSLSSGGEAIIALIADVRRQWIENHFAGWEPADRAQLVMLMAAMTRNAAL